jgi:hypothetical protein
VPIDSDSDGSDHAREDPAEPGLRDARDMPRGPGAAGGRDDAGRRDALRGRDAGQGDRDAPATRNARTGTDAPVIRQQQIAGQVRYRQVVDSFYQTPAKVG